jgi:hypothetical protein
VRLLNGYDICELCLGFENRLNSIDMNLDACLVESLMILDTPNKLKMEVIECNMGPCRVRHHIHEHTS